MSEVRMCLQRVSPPRAVLGAGVWLAILVGLVLFPPRAARAFREPELGLAEDHLMQVCIEHGVTVRRYQRPSRANSRVFGPGRVYPFRGEFVFQRLADVFQFLDGLLAFQTLQLRIFPDEKTPVIAYCHTAPQDPVHWHVQLALLVYAKMDLTDPLPPNPWQEGFPCEAHVTSATGLFPIFDQVEACRLATHTLELCGPFSVTLTEEIDANGDAFLKGIFLMRFVKPDPMGGAIPIGAWRRESPERRVLEGLFAGPRLVKGIAPTGRIEEIDLWYDEFEVFGTRKQMVFLIQGRTFVPKAAAEFCLELRKSGTFRQVSMTRMDARHLPEHDLFLHSFTISAVLDARP